MYSKKLLEQAKNLNYTKGKQLVSNQAKAMSTSKTAFSKTAHVIHLALLFTAIATVLQDFSSHKHHLYNARRQVNALFVKYAAFNVHRHIQANHFDNLHT